MKNLKSIFAIFAIMAFGIVTPTFADPINIAAIYMKIEPVKEKKVFDLYLSNLSNTDYVTVTITDEAGTLMHGETFVGKARFAKRFNLVNLPNGIYFVNLERGNETTVQPISINYNTITVDEAKKVSFNAPKIKTSGKMVNVKQNFTGNTTIDVTILNDADTIVYSSKFSNLTDGLDKNFNLTALTSGNYTISISTPFSTYREIVAIK